MPSDGIPFEVKINVHVFAKPARVIVPVCFGVSECLQNDVGFHENVFDPEKQNSHSHIISLVTSKSLKFSTTK